MIQAPIQGLLEVWGQLWQAYYGEHNYGSSVAEIYRYHLMPCSPLREAYENGHRGSLFADEVEAENHEAAQTMRQLATMFADKLDCVVSIEEESDMEKHHRWHVSVEHKD